MGVRWHNGALLAFDLETTGVDRSVDVPVSFALVRMKNGRVTERTTRLVQPGREIPPEASAVHGISTEQARREGVPLGDAVEEIIDSLVRASARRMPVVGMRVDFDLGMIDHLGRLLTGLGLVERGWRGPALDVSVIDRHVDPWRRGRRTLVDLCGLYDVSMGRAHDATADAEASLGVLRALCVRHPLLPWMPLRWLQWRQTQWHRSWALSYSRWRVGEGMAPLRPDELAWPLPDPVPPGLASTG
jgi:DNA polymerase-3 subunit epsilon